ncbi:membrane protein, partial [Streptomyces sp. RSD-27]
MRTGNEPLTARSPLRLRFWLSLWGLLWAAGGAAVFSLAERPGWAAACAALAVLAAV